MLTRKAELCVAFGPGPILPQLKAMMLEWALQSGLCLWGLCVLPLLSAEQIVEDKPSGGQSEPRPCPKNTDFTPTATVTGERRGLDDLSLSMKHCGAVAKATYLLMNLALGTGPSSKDSSSCSKCPQHRWLQRSAPHDDGN